MMPVVHELLLRAMRRETGLVAVALSAALGAYLGVATHVVKTVDIGAVKTTVGDLRSLHAEVLVRGQEIRGEARLRDGDEVETAASGRARVRLDDGTILIVDANTKLSLHAARITLASGRLFVQAGASARTEVALADTIATVVSSAAAFDARGTNKNASESMKIYCARGELVLTSNGRSTHVPSGETATFSARGADSTKVAPETAFDDWTGGLAVPWSGERTPASAIAEVWAGSGGNPGNVDPSAPLVVRSEKVDVSIEGELAVTRTRTTYFNGSDMNVDADVRMALPEGAVISRVARGDENVPTERDAVLGTGQRAANPGVSASRLEWAGGGWMRGTLANIPAGGSVDLLVDYVEWLSESDGRATYRFPMSSESASPTVGSLAVRVESRSPAEWLSASAGTLNVGGAIEFRKADVRPTGDMVVELVPSVVRRGVARAYVDASEPNEDPYVLVRTEVPPLAESGVTLALVVDTSSSVGPAQLETERAAVDALLESLGPKDSVVVFGADQSVAALGPDKPTSVTPELRTHIARELAKVHAGGASNLGLGFERAADVLDAQSEHAGSGMVVYLGDGRPTVGETTALDLRKRLSRRTGGVPRLGAIAVGEGANRWMLAELVAGGPVYDVLDRPDAARAGSALVADALAPTIRDVSLALGPTVDRTYPRDPHAVLAGSTFTVAGRLRGALPREIVLRYRRGTELVEEVRPLAVVPSPASADVARRWAHLRIAENVTRADGVEPAIALATKAKLTTPWTGWFFDGSNASLPWADRLLALSPTGDVAFANRVEPAPMPPSLLLEPPAAFEGEASIEEAAEVAARHSLQGAMAPMIACRDARASTKPGISGELRVGVSVSGDGRASKVVVEASRAGENDPVLDRCIRVVVEAVPFFASGVAVSFTWNLSLPPGLTSNRTTCSVASTLPLAVRRGIWRARKAKNTIDYDAAAHACELPTWNDRRTLLAILVDGLNAVTGTAFARRLAAAGETDAASFVREELVRRANTGALSYEELRTLLIDDEPKIDRVLDKAFRAARTDDARLSILRRFLRLAPHSPLGRRLLLTHLETTNARAPLLDTIDAIRNDVFADAGLLAECASALRRLGMDDEGRRAFGDLVERAPRDPWTLGYVGDRLRAEGLYEDALAAYERLDAAMPDDPAVALRLALAQAGAGRLDVATRLLDRVAQTGGRGDDGRLGELASILEASLLAGARQASPAPAGETDALLARRLALTPLPDVASIVLVRTPLADDKIELLVARQENDKDELPAELDASAMGIAATRIERGSGVARIHLRRASGLASGRPTHGLVTALVVGTDRARTRVVAREIDIPAGERGIELRWNGEVFQ